MHATQSEPLLRSLYCVANNATIMLSCQGFAAREYTPTSRGFDRFVGFYTGGETHFTHVASYHFLGDLPEWWTPPDNDTLPNPSGCSSLWDLHNDSAIHGPSPPEFAYSANGTYSAEITGAAFEVSLREKQVLAPDAPLFAYVAFHGVHLPLEVPGKYLQRYTLTTHDRHGNNSTSTSTSTGTNTGTSASSHDSEAGENDTGGVDTTFLPFGGDVDRWKLAAMVTAVDDAVGRITTALKDANFWNDTIVLLTTDNGAPVCARGVPAAELCTRNCGGSNGLLRGSKMTDWQGGVRGLAVLGGGWIPASRRNTTFHGMVHQADW